MRVRTLLVATGVVSALLGGVIVYLVMTVPNDVQAAALLKKAKQQIAAGNDDRARESLSRIVQQYPRTDAAASATVALVALADQERQKLEDDLQAVRRAQTALEKQLADQGLRVETIEKRPPPAPVIIHEPAKKAPVKKAPTTRRRRRR